jgi:hypothetical protein
MDVLKSAWSQIVADQIEENKDKAGKVASIHEITSYMKDR